MDALRSDGVDFPVSVWMKRVKTDDEPRVIVVIEPVARTTAHLSLDPAHMEVLFCDENFLTLFGCSDEDDVVGRNVEEFFPSLSIPDTSESPLVEQQITGRTKSGNVFPVTVRFTGRGTVPTAGAGTGVNDEEECGRGTYIRGALLVYGECVCMSFDHCMRGHVCSILFVVFGTLVPLQLSCDVFCN